jgi:hypothetical protein
MRWDEPGYPGGVGIAGSAVIADIAVIGNPNP